MKYECKTLIRNFIKKKLMDRLEYNSNPFSSLMLGIYSLFLVFINWTNEASINNMGETELFSFIPNRELLDQETVN